MARCPHGTVVACGGASGYNADGSPARQPAQAVHQDAHGPRFSLVRSRGEYWRFLYDLDPLVAAGAVKHRERVLDGLESAPEAFTILFNSRTLGKVVVRV